MGIETSLALAAASAGAQALGSITSGNANAQASLYQAQVARNNQIIANQNAQLELAKGQQQEGISREQTAQTIGEQRAGLASNGLDIASGSPLRLQTDTARLGEINALTIRNNAARSAWNYRAQGANFGAEADLDEKKASGAASGGLLSALGSLIGGGSNVAAKWRQWQQAGGGGGDTNSSAGAGDTNMTVFG